jgi:competence protein ComEA
MLIKKKLMLLLLALSLVLSFSLPLFAANNGKININKAGVEELATLERVGEKYAQRIVEYRQTNGPFKKPEDIMNVKGIGSKIWEANKDRLAVE